MSSSRSKDPLFVTYKGTALHVGSIWAWIDSDDGGGLVWYFRFLDVQDGVAGLHALIHTQDGRTVGADLGMFDSAQIREVTNEDEIGFAELVLMP